MTGANLRSCGAWSGRTQWRTRPVFGSERPRVSNPNGQKLHFLLLHHRERPSKGRALGQLPQRWHRAASTEHHEAGIEMAIVTWRILNGPIDGMKMGLNTKAKRQYGATKGVDGDDGGEENLPAPFEWDAPLYLPEKIEMAISCVLLVPVIRVLATIVFAGLGALWCTFIYYLFSCFGAEPAKHPPMARRVRVALLRYPCMVRGTRPVH